VIRRITVLWMAFVMLVSLSIPAFAEEEQPSVTRGQVVKAILAAAQAYHPDLHKEDIIKGYEDGKLKEDQAVQMVEALVMVSRAFPDLPTPVGNDLRMASFPEGFTDIPAWAKAEIDKLTAAGVLVGNSDGTLGSSEPITLDELHTIIARIWALKGSNLKDDFFEAVNKEWLNTSTIPDGDMMGGVFSDLTRGNDDKLAAILKDLVGQKFKEGTKEQKLADYYTAALDTKSRNQAGIEPIANYLAAIKKASSLQELIQADNDLEKATSLSTLFNFMISADAKDSSTNVLYYIGMNMGLDKNSYVTNDENAKQLYIAFMTKLLVLSGEQEQSAKEQASKIYEMEKSLAAVSLDPQEQGDVTKYYNPYTIQQFAALYPHVDIKHMLKEANLSQVDKVIVIDEKQAKKYAEYLQEDQLELLKSYSKVWLLQQTAFKLTDDYRKAVKDFNAGFFGITGERSDEDSAIDSTKAYLNNYMGQMYAERYFSKEAKQDVEHMVKQFIDIYKERIKAVDWMSEATKQKAIKKLETMQVKIGYPDKWNDQLSKVTIKTYDKGGSLFANAIAIQKAKADATKAKLGKPVDKSEWEMNVYEVNAYYNPLNNEIVFPAGILQAPFYDIHAKKEANMGAIGIVIAHEISHAFDNNGSAYDENGNANNWWTEEDHQKFMEKCQAVIDFYNGIEIVPGATNSGLLTLSENVADLGGVAASLQVVSGMAQPDYKVYFESYANVWKATMTREIAAYLSANDVHSANKVRVNRTVVNFPEFYTTYGIQAGDGMYVAPEQRVSIW